MPPGRVFITGARQLGYQPSVSLEEGMRLTRAWAREEGLVANS
jgi:nucleoside-diphosphate-sugar epimerase